MVVLVADDNRITGLDLSSTKQLWSHPLPMTLVPWGTAVDRGSRVLVTPTDGQVMCFGKAKDT